MEVKTPQPRRIYTPADVTRSGWSGGDAPAADTL